MGGETRTFAGEFSHCGEVTLVAAVEALLEKFITEIMAYAKILFSLKALEIVSGEGGTAELEKIFPQAYLVSALGTGLYLKLVTTTTTASPGQQNKTLEPICEEIQKNHETIELTTFILDAVILLLALTTLILAIIEKKCPRRISRNDFVLSVGRTQPFAQMYFSKFPSQDIIISLISAMILTFTGGTTLWSSKLSKTVCKPELEFTHYLISVSHYRTLNRFKNHIISQIFNLLAMLPFAATVILQHW